MARRSLGSSNGGLSRLTIRFVVTPVERRTHCALGASFLTVFSNGTDTSATKVMSNLPAMKDSMRVERSGMIVKSMPSR